MNRNAIFSLPPPSGTASAPIFPLFMPFAGCPHRCVFCAQDLQTGQAPVPLTQLLEQTTRALHARQQRGAPAVELAFYGGTFTRLPWQSQKACLEMANRAKAEGTVMRVRCSTRPDAVPVQSLMRLRQYGLDCIELGIQSFSDHVLAASGRGYTAAQARAGCENVHEAGLTLGIQLLPGLLGTSDSTLMDDMHEALTLTPALMRLYPCLVVQGTALAALWQANQYVAWDDAKAVQQLAPALALAWEHHIPVIRLSVAPEADFDCKVLAGPRHPALGNLIQAEALYIRLSTMLTQYATKPTRLILPKYCQGLFAGHKRTMLPRWAALGITTKHVRWIDDQYGEWVFAS